MAMTPEEQNRMNKLEQTVQNLLLVQDVSFIENIKRRIDLQSFAKTIKLGDLFDVEVEGATNNQVIKIDTSDYKWKPANDIDT